MHVFGFFFVCVFSVCFTSCFYPLQKYTLGAQAPHNSAFSYSGLFLLTLSEDCLAVMSCDSGLWGGTQCSQELSIGPVEGVISSEL